MKRLLFSFASQALFGLLVWLGAVEGIPGAGNVLTFLICLCAFFVTIPLFFPKTKEVERSPWLGLWTGRLLSVVCIGTLIWFGWIFTALVWVWLWLASTIYLDRPVDAEAD